ncbi:unnamed protein product, partial [Rotaria magnacalcarata]
MLQAGGEQLEREIHKLCNKAWQEGTIPDEWGKSIQVPIPKKGDLSECASYRTISDKSHGKSTPSRATQRVKATTRT